MSLRLEMLQVARLAPKLLRESADLVREFYRNQVNEKGGFNNRDGSPDLYYTVFGIEGLMALRDDPPIGTLVPWLESFGDGEGLDFIHLACLSRCWADLGIERLGDDDRQKLVERISAYRGRDGGFGNETDPEEGSTTYATFLAFGAYQDLGVELPDSEKLMEFLCSMEMGTGGYANNAKVPVATTPTTAAALTILRLLNEKIPEKSGEWLLAQSLPKGGFRATTGAPIPDLLSTAVALHGLSGLEISLDSVREPSLDFVDSLWTNKGAFHGNWTDDVLDCEYTYYGLLALGHLSL